MDRDVFDRGDIVTIWDPARARFIEVCVDDTLGYPTGDPNVMTIETVRVCHVRPMSQIYRTSAADLNGLMSPEYVFDPDGYATMGDTAPDGVTPDVNGE